MDVCSSTNIFLVFGHIEQTEFRECFATARFRIFFSYCLLSENIKLKIYRTGILLVVLHGCEA
jgi:hypothetical protein